MLKTPASEEVVRQLLPNVEVVVAAHATDAVPHGTGNVAAASGKHDLTSVTIPGLASSEPVTVGEQTYLVWKQSLHIPWPRTRLQRPAVYFTATLNLCAKASTDVAGKPEREHLPPYEPVPANVLEPLNSDPTFRGKEIYLADDRLIKVSPKPSKKDEVTKPVRGASKRAFPVLPALFTRIRYSSLADGVIASLTIEASHVVDGLFSVRNVDVMAMESGFGGKATVGARIESLADTDWPMQMHAGDETVLLYKLAAPSRKGSSTSPSLLSVAIQATVKLTQGSEVDIDMSWQSQTSDQPSDLEPNYRWSRPLSQQALFSTSGLRSPTPPAEAEALPTTVPQTDGGLTFFFSALPTATQERDLQLKIKCFNASSRSRRFALLPLRSPIQQEARLSSESTPREDQGNGLSSTPNSHCLRAPDVSCDTPDVRIGPLPAGETFETEMNFRVLSTGVLDLGLVRIVDLDTRRVVDVEELPDVIGLASSAHDPPYEPKGTVPSRNDEITKEMDAATDRWRKETGEWLAQRDGSRNASQ